MKPSGADRAREWFDTYTRDLSAEDLQRLFTHDTRDAYRFFSRGLDEEQIGAAAVVEAGWRSAVRQVFVAFTLKLPPARRALYLGALAIALLGSDQAVSRLHGDRRSVRDAVLPDRACCCRRGRTARSRCSSAC